MGNQGNKSTWVIWGNLCFHESRAVRAIRAIKTISEFMEIRATKKVLTINAIRAIRETRVVMTIRPIKAISAISWFLGLSQSYPNHPFVLEALQVRSGTPPDQSGTCPIWNVSDPKCVQS